MNGDVPLWLKKLTQNLRKDLESTFGEEQTPTSSWILLSSTASRALLCFLPGFRSYDDVVLKPQNIVFLSLFLSQHHTLNLLPSIWGLSIWGHRETNPLWSLLHIPMCQSCWEHVGIALCLLHFFIYHVCCWFLPYDIIVVERTWVRCPSNFLCCKLYYILTLRLFCHSIHMMGFQKPLTFLSFLD